MKPQIIMVLVDFGLAQTNFFYLKADMDQLTTHHALEMRYRRLVVSCPIRRLHHQLVYGAGVKPTLFVHVGEIHGGAGVTPSPRSSTASLLKNKKVRACSINSV